MPLKAAKTLSFWLTSSSRCTPRLPPGRVFDYAIVERRPGFLVVQFSGKGSKELFEHEGGGHRWQRVPPTEKKGRTQTSTVTVAVLAEPTAHEFEIRSEDLEYKTCRGSGAGGQHRNVTDSAVQLTHLPSGLTVRCESERSQTQNKAQALGVLRARLMAASQAKLASARTQERKEQVGTGMRGDKRRTIAVQRDQVVDHVTGKRISYSEYKSGKLDLLK